MSLLDQVSAERITADTLELVGIASPTGDTREMAEKYEALLRSVGCHVERYEFVPGNPTLVAVYGNGPGKTLLFNGHMDTVPLAHEPACVKEGRVYGRGACDMKGSLACIAEAIRVLRDSGTRLAGKMIIVANSLHESPGGHGEDLIELTENVELKADAAVVMEGASSDCTIAQFGSATFEIIVRREGEPSHQLYTVPGTPHPVNVTAAIIDSLNELNRRLEQEYVEDIGYASYFIGSVHSGQFYNQHPNRAELVGVRRYGPQTTFSEVERELRTELDKIAARFAVTLDVKLTKVRDGYRIDKHDPAVAALVDAVRQVKNRPLPLAGKKIVTDAGIFVSQLGIPTLCHGPDQSSAHADVEFVEISELEATVKVYLQLIENYLSGETGENNLIERMK
ncbi:M20 family metallopeptidase [Paenibacillus sp. MBLB4367]|uniref:M20 family metallopeptidase n=1 Tax=Paenibacillus sp. MBLB4367 TaxID=3384767 RepID=UPI0039083F37